MKLSLSKSEMLRAKIDHQTSTSPDILDTRFFSSFHDWRYSVLGETFWIFPKREDFKVWFLLCS